MKQKYKSLISNTFIFTLGSFGSKLITFFLVPLYTNFLTIEEYGTADLVVTCSNILIPILSIVIQDAVFRFSLSKENDKGVVIKNSFVVLLIGSCIACCLYPLICLYNAIAEWSWYLIAITIFQMYSNVLYAYSKSIGKTKLYAIVSVINTFVLAISNVLFLCVFHLGVRGYLLANILGLVVADIILVVFTNAFRDCFRSKVNAQLMKQMLIFSAPLVINNLSWWILNSSSRVLLETFYSAAELGLYTTASKIPSLLSIVTTIFMQAWNISAAKDYDEERESTFYTNIFKAFQFIIFIGAAFIVMITKPFMRIYVGKVFFDSWKHVPLLIYGIVCYSFSSFFGAIYGAVKKNKNVAVTTVLAAIINFTVALVLLNKIGVWAATFSNAISYFVICIYRMYDSRRFFKFDISHGKFWTSAVVLLIQVIFVSLDFGIYLVSGITIVILVLINHDSIKACHSFMKQIKKRL